MKIDWRGALGIALSVALLVWALHGISLGEVWGQLRASNLPLFLLSAVVATLVFPLRAARWRPILGPSVDGVPFAALWRATAIGMMVNNVVPARAGEVARAFALTREAPRVPFSAALASLAVDRLFDAVVVFLLTGVAVLDPAFPGGRALSAATGGASLSRLTIGAIVLIVGLLIALYIPVLFPGRLADLYAALARRVAPDTETRGRELVMSFATGLGVLRSPGRCAATFAWALALWYTNALSFWIGFRAAGITVPFSASLFLQGIIALGVAVPQAPGYFGVFEAVAKPGLAIYGVPPAQAVGWAIGFHVLTFLPITIIGAWYAVRLGLHLRDMRPAASAPQPET